MSAKDKSKFIDRSKKRKVNQLNASNTTDKSEVIIVTKTKHSNNKSYFSDISHKNSSGSNNWAKFALLSMQSEDRQSSRKSSIKKNRDLTVKTLSLDGSKESLPSNLSNTHKNKSHVNFKPEEARPLYKTNSSEGKKEKNYHFVSSSSDRPSSKPVLTKHIAMDCEMVGVEIGVNKNMLARISLVNSHGQCVYDKFVKPSEPVVDYRTRVSGVRPKDLENATDFKIVQQEVADILKGRILVGHALKNDLKVLYLSHPRHSIRDTSKFKKFREGKTPALRKLAKKYLGVTIQEGEHSSVQDALAALQLYKMFKKEWESSIYSKKHVIKKVKDSKPNQLSVQHKMSVEL